MFKTYIEIIACKDQGNSTTVVPTRTSLEITYKDYYILKRYDNDFQRNMIQSYFIDIRHKL